MNDVKKIADVSDSKSSCRARFKAVVAQSDFSGEHEARMAQNLRIVLSGLLLVGVYSALAGELSLQRILGQTGLRFETAYPRISGNELVFHRAQSNKEFILNRFNILEPDPSVCPVISVHELQAVIVPGLAFDRKCTRLGRGKGFYDRALVGYKGMKVGLSSVLQISNEDLPREPHDVAMDYIVTENYILQRLES